MSAPDLNPAQHQAVNTLKGPMLVLAGAGSGKTRVITFRIAKLIQNGIRPERILAVTFTNKAAKEMRERAVGLLGKRRKKSDKAPEISTFHSLCVRILRRNIDQLGYPSEFPIYDRSDQESLARAALRDIRVGHDRLRPGDLLHLIGGWKSQSVRPEHASEHAKSDKELLAALAYSKYQDNLRAAGAVDFDDLLLLTEEVLDRFPEVRVKESGRFDHLLIDEYQDTNGLQYRIVRRLAERHRNLCVVGDDDQSIYGWRGAEVEHILNFKNDWPEATVVRLESNYRSREAILKLANTLIAHNSTRHDKVLKPYRKGGEPPRFIRFEDETTEAHAVVREIRARLDNPPSDKRVYPSDFAILFRTNEQPRAFEVELRRHQVPYVLVGGQSFYDRKEVRDVLAYLKVLAFPRDEVSLLRIINTPARGIGSGTVKNLVQSAVDSGRPLWEVLGEVRQNQELTSVVIDRVDGFRRLIEHYKDECEREGSDLVETVRELLQQIDYKAELQRLYDNPADVESRLNAIEEVVNALGSYVSRAEAPSLRGFLEEMALSTRDDLKDNDDKKKKEAVTLMTLHSAKGLEFPHVYMVGMEEGILPHQRSVLENKSVDEERRLAYVGVTRAQDTLTLTFCKGRMKWGKLRASIPSRFIMEMRGETERANRAAEAARAMFEQAAAFAAKKEDEKNKKAQKKSGKRPQRASVPPETAATTRPRSAPTSTSTPGALPRALAEGLSGPALGPVQDGFEGSTISLRPGASTGDADPKQRAALAALASLDDAVDQGLSSLPPEPAELARSVVSKPAAKPSAPLRSSRGPSKRPARGNPFDPTSTPSVSPRHFDSSAPTTPQASRPDAVVERVPAPDSTHLTPDPGSEPSSAAPRSAPRERQASRQAEVMPAHPVPTAPPAVTPEPSSDEERLRRALDVLSGALDLD